MELNKEKQIEEMALNLRNYCRYYDDGICGVEDHLAQYLFHNGYRKASEVAREIFEEIERAFFKYYDSAVTYSSPNLPYHLREAVSFSLNEMFMKVGELEKKYTEGEE